MREWTIGPGGVVWPDYMRLIGATLHGNNYQCGYISKEVGLFIDQESMYVL